MFTKTDNRFFSLNPLTTNSFYNPTHTHIQLIKLTFSKSLGRLKPLLYQSLYKNISRIIILVKKDYSSSSPVSTEPVLYDWVRSHFILTLTVGMEKETSSMSMWHVSPSGTTWVTTCGLSYTRVVHRVSVSWPEISERPFWPSEWSCPTGSELESSYCTTCLTPITSFSKSFIYLPSFVVSSFNQGPGLQSDCPVGSSMLM